MARRRLVPELPLHPLATLLRTVLHELKALVHGPPKETRDASRRGFSRAVERYGYYVQDPFYLNGLDVLSPRTRRFAIIAIEKDPPYASAVYELDATWRELGRLEYLRHMRTWQECQKAGVWPGYPGGVQELNAPEWISQRLDQMGER